MKRFKQTLYIILISILVLAFSGCHKDQITRWRCIPYEGCLIELSMDNERDLVYVAADYQGFVPPDSSLEYHFLFYDNSIYIKNGDTLRYLDRTFHTPDCPIFVITSQSKGTMDFRAICYFYDCSLSSQYVTDYHFIRIP